MNYLTEQGVDNSALEQIELADPKAFDATSKELEELLQKSGSEEVGPTRHEIIKVYNERARLIGDSALTAAAIEKIVVKDPERAYIKPKGSTEEVKHRSFRLTSWKKPSSS